MRKAEIKFTIELDENNLPVKIDWEASDAEASSACKAMMIALWDEKEKSTMRIDLWTKEMMVDEMKQFVHQNVMTLADTFKRATGEDEMAHEMRRFGSFFAEKMEIEEPPKG
ncbi:MAG: gliding motility-associated protein GldC [Bacteroidetes bacterium]|nr:MAG: gliding motility-associated protein GldC [Bacteroidota bacterium]